MSQRMGLVLSLIAAFGFGMIFARADKFSATRPMIETLPESRGGQELLGQTLPKLEFTRWLNTPDHQPLETAGSVTLYRWWTDTCPYCEATLPAIEKLRTKYESKGLKVVAVYHPKPPGDVNDEKVLAAAKARNYHGIVAVDPRWTELKKAWLTPGESGRKKKATSVSLLVDGKGVIRFVHPGVMYFPSDKPEDAEASHDYELIDRGIAALLEEQKLAEK
jgi:thiol-disulfide isomerase/thioredoxin